MNPRLSSQRLARVYESSATFDPKRSYPSFIAGDVATSNRRPWNQPAAKKELGDPGIGQNLRRAVLDAGLALLKHQRIVGHLQGLLGILLDQHDRYTFVPQL